MNNAKITEANNNKILTLLPMTGKNKKVSKRILKIVRNCEKLGKNRQGTIIDIKHETITLFRRQILRIC